MYTMLRNSQGFTLLEVMTVIAVFAISVSIATPSYKFVFEKYRFKAAVEAIVSNLQSARSEAIKINKDTFVVFNTGGNWTMRSSNSLTCALSAAGCTASDWENVSHASEYSGTSIDSTTLSSDQVKFDYIRGTSNIGAITVSMNEFSVNIKLNKLGYTKICSNNEPTSSRMGYGSC